MKKNQPGCPCCTGTTICVGACGGLPVAGAVVTVLAADGSVLATCTTGATGCCKVKVSGRRRVEVTINGQVVFSAVRNLSGRVAIALGSNSGLVCCGGYAIPEVLTATDAEGTFAFVYFPNFFFPIWFGGHPVQRTSAPVTTPNNVCVVGPASPGPVKVCYQMVCFAGQKPTFSVQRSWSWVFRQGTLTPIWFQDGSGIAAGQPCVTGPPAICGSPLTDTAGFGADPSSTSPFTLSGTPAAAPANSTADPIGGPVVIGA